MKGIITAEKRSREGDSMVSSTRSGGREGELLEAEGGFLLRKKKIYVRAGQGGRVGLDRQTQKLFRSQGYAGLTVFFPKRSTELHRIYEEEEKVSSMRERGLGRR